MQRWERFTVSTGIAIGEPGDLPLLFGGNNTAMSEADLAHAGDLLPVDHPERDSYINQGFRLVTVDDPTTAPVTITAYQAAQQLFANGGTVAAMQALVDGSGDEKLKFWWSKATVYERDNENVETLRVLLANTGGLPQFEDQAGMDAFFLAASAW